LQLPSVRRLLIEFGLNPSNIKGSGIRGKILKGDVLGFIDKNKVSPVDKNELAKRTSHTETSGTSTSSTTSSNVKNIVVENKVSSTKQPIVNKFVDMPNSTMRSVIAKRLTSSKRDNPHAYITSEVNIDKVLNLRKEMNVGDIKLSINDFLIKGIAKSLETEKDLNITMQNDKITMQNSIDISVAVAIEGGLITPIVFNANKKGLVEINHNVKELGALAKKGALKPEHYQGGSFCISNLGMFGVDYFSAVINPPQCAILTVGNKVDKLTLSENGKVKSESFIILQLCYNSAAIEAEKSAKFLDKLKFVLQNPTMLI